MLAASSRAGDEDGDEALLPARRGAEAGQEPEVQQAEQRRQGSEAEGDPGEQHGAQPPARGSWRGSKASPRSAALACRQP